MSLYKIENQNKQYMKTRSIFFLFSLVALCLVSCSGKKSEKASLVPEDEPSEVLDSTIYGRCGSNTAMSVLEVICDGGDTLTLNLNLGSSEADVQGGLHAGDMLAVIETLDDYGERAARKVINLTTLLGKWTSLDREFTIHEDGSVEGDVKEPNPYVSWRIVNGNLVLSKDTFSIYGLGVDSLLLENSKGIYVYKRVMAE